MTVTFDVRPRHIVDAAQQHLVTTDRVQADVGEQFVWLDVVPGAEARLSVCVGDGLHGSSLIGTHGAAPCLSSVCSNRSFGCGRTATLEQVKILTSSQFILECSGRGVKRLGHL